MLNLLDIHTLFSIALPLIVALVAGLLRQDRLPALINEGISYVFVFGLSLLSLYLDGKLGANFTVDYTLSIAYTTSLLNSPLLKPLQQYLQTNVVFFGKPTASSPVGVSVDVPRLVEEIVPLLPEKLAPSIATELSRYIRLNGDMNATVQRAAVQSSSVPPSTPKVGG